MAEKKTRVPGDGRTAAARKARARRAEIKRRLAAEDIELEVVDRTDAQELLDTVRQIGARLPVIEARLDLLNERENMNSFALAVPATLGPAAPRSMGGQPLPDRRPLTDCAMDDLDIALDRLYALVERLGDRLAPVRLAAPAMTGASQGESPTPALPPLAQRMRDAKTKAGLVARNLETILDELEV